MRVDERLQSAGDSLRSAFDPEPPAFDTVLRSRNRARAVRRAGVGILALVAIGAISVPLLSTRRISREITTVTQAPAPPATTAPSTTAAGQDRHPVSDVPLERVNWAAVTYPFSCGVSPATGRAVAYPSPAPDTHLAVVLATCVAGAGTPPSAILVYDSATSPTTPHLTQTLVAYDDNWVPKPDAVSAGGSALAVQVDGYAGAAARCCPNVHATLTWTWNGLAYKAIGTEPGHNRLGPASVQSLPNGSYTDDREGTPHYILTVDVSGDGFAGSLTFLYQDGKTDTVFRYSAAARPDGTFTMTTNTGATHPGTYAPKTIVLTDCGSYLTWASPNNPGHGPPESCTFGFSG